MLPTHAIRCTRCLVLLDAPRIARFPRCANCGEQLTCADTVESSAEVELRQLKDWLRTLTIQFDQVSLNLRWIREYRALIVEATRAERPWHVQLTSVIVEWWPWIFLGVMINSPYLMFVVALALSSWLWQRRRLRKYAEVIETHQKRRRQITGCGTP